MKTSLTRQLIYILCALLAAAVLAPTALSAQEAPAGGEAKAPAAKKETFSVPVQVVHGGQDNALAGKPVILRAARAKGPFEQTDPKPKHEWSAVTDESGKATFTGVPKSLIDEGLRLHAVTTHGGMSFKSAPKVPSPGISLRVPVYERGRDVSAVKIDDLQTIVHVWEDNLFFQQFYRLSVEGDKVLDMSMLSGEEYEHGLPIVLPVKARGIDIQAPGQTKVVESTAYWKGTLKPGEAVPVSVAFSMTADRPDFVYSQEFDYPVANASVVVPLESRHEKVKIPYFDGLTLAAPGFAPDNVGTDRGALGSQNNGLFLTAKNQEFTAGQSLKFKLSGLPFAPPIGAMTALGLGFLGALFVFAYARRENERVDESHTSGELIEMLVQEREELLDELTLLEEDFQKGHVSELEYERESLLLRERIALVMKKIGDLEEQAA